MTFWSSEQALAHHMRFNAYNRLLDGKVGAIDQQRVSAPVRFVGEVPSGMASAAEIERIFAIDSDNPLAHAGCQLRYSKGELACIGSGAPVGALLPNGKRFDLTLPFHYPFTQILDDASSKGGP